MNIELDETCPNKDMCVRTACIEMLANVGGRTAGIRIDCENCNARYLSRREEEGVTK